MERSRRAPDCGAPGGSRRRLGGSRVSVFIAACTRCADRRQGQLPPDEYAHQDAVGGAATAGDPRGARHHDRAQRAAHEVRTVEGPAEAEPSTATLGCRPAILVPAAGGEVADAVALVLERSGA